MALTHDTRRALAERVQRKVEGRGIPRQAVDDAVARVSDALDQRSSAPAGDVHRSTIVAVFTAASAPDLGSRVRSALQSEAVTPVGIGSGTVGRHTVVTVRLADGSRALAERAAARLAVSVSFVPDSLLSSSR